MAQKGGSVRRSPSIRMLSFVFPEAPVEYYVFDGRSALYHGAVVLGFSNGTCTIRLLKVKGEPYAAHETCSTEATSNQPFDILQDGSQTSCSVATLRPSPPTAAAGVPSVGRGEPVDVFEPSTSSWRAMVTMHSAALPLAPNTTLVLLQPGRRSCCRAARALNQPGCAPVYNLPATAHLSTLPCGCRGPQHLRVHRPCSAPRAAVHTWHTWGFTMAPTASGLCLPLDQRQVSECHVSAGSRTSVLPS